jgi:hypothetical protein
MAALTSSSALATIIRTGFREYYAAHPWYIIFTTEWPRAVLQCLFFTMLGQITGGDSGGRYAFTGSVAMIMLLSTVTGVSDVPATELWAGTLYRLQLSRMPLAVTFALRSAPWIVQALATALLSLAITGPLTGNTSLSIGLIPALPLFALMAVSSAAAGLAVALPALGHRSDVIVSNGLTYLIMATGGVLIPVTHEPALRIIGTVLPLSHGVLAVRAYLAHQPWLTDAGLEALVGVGWAILAIMVCHRQNARARALGTADFT